ncbi:response regulator [Sphingomonas sp. TREG-RG-20F-R18-01]|uniref:response regulator n=1 Tax=Sphingomonas sp. TREG-RG-20F-R18-01 TaxID=2914982 RepID=UPI001F5A9743|nr:response regulator [Sphingomonas sp. TREG-RG-20F-R18-01]
MCHVLVIEDEPLIAEYVAALAEMAGATSSTIADTVKSAVDAAHNQAPDLILSDVNLLRGERGPDAVAAIRSKMGAIPVIFITATALDCIDCDYASAILEKPVQPERVIAAISAARCC